MTKKITRNLNILKWVASFALIALLVVNFHDRIPHAFAGGVGGGNLISGLQGLQGAQQDLHGWAWSDMPDGSDQNSATTNHQAGRGLGWISMNGADTGTDGNSYYKVTFDGATGQFSGNAWSEMGGWLSFAPSGPYPAEMMTVTVPGGGSSTRNVLPTTSATIDPSCLSSHGRSCVVTGWVRFIAGEDTNTQNTGGWDGWVNMSGHSYAQRSPTYITSSFGVTYDADPTDTANYGKFSGYAWGSEVTGWINFNGVSVEVTPPLQPGACSDPNATNYGSVATCTCAGIGSYAGTNYSYTYPFAQGQTYPTQCQNPLLCNIPTALNYGGALPCRFSPGTCQDPAALNPGGALPCRYPQIDSFTTPLGQSNLDCTNGTATISWSTVGTSSCSASTSGTATGFSGAVSTSGSASISGILQNGQVTNFTITCTAQSGYTPPTITSSTSIMCPVVGGGTQTPVVPHPIYKEN